MSIRIIELKAFGTLTGAYLMKEEGTTLRVPVEFKGKKYHFIYELTGNVRKLRQTDEKEFDDYAHEAILTNMELDG